LMDWNVPRELALNRTARKSTSMCWNLNLLSMYLENWLLIYFSPCLSPFCFHTFLLDYISYGPTQLAWDKRLVGKSTFSSVEMFKKNIIFKKLDIILWNIKHSIQLLEVPNFLMYGYSLFAHRTLPFCFYGLS
jgi:hypothetical protein